MEMKLALAGSIIGISSLFFYYKRKNRLTKEFSDLPIEEIIR